MDSPAIRDGRNHGRMPAPFITMISESVVSLFRLWATATTSAMGAITITRLGMMRLVMPMKTKMFWPWRVIRSMLRRPGTLVRFSVGVEAAGDLREDLQRSASAHLPVA